MIYDTNIFIYLEKKVATAVALFEKKSDQIWVSAITYIELIQGADNKKKMHAIENFLAAYQISIIDLNQEISICARMLIKQYAQSHHLTLGDALIAATALSSNKILLTANYKDFRFINSLEVKKFSPNC